MKNRPHSCLLPSIIVSLLLASCGGGTGDAPPSVPASSASTPSNSVPSGSVVSVADGPTQFIKKATLHVDPANTLSSIAFTIQPRTGALSLPVHAIYSIAYLNARGAFDSATGMITVPVFGLYAGYSNQVDFTLEAAGSTSKVSTTMDTPAYIDSTAQYDNITVTRPRIAASLPGMDYLFLKSSTQTPVVVDSDGYLRWLGAALPPASDDQRGISAASIFTGNRILVGSPNEATLFTIDLDGTVRRTDVGANIKDFHHDISPGKEGLLIETDTTDGTTTHVESTLSEMSLAGEILRTWDLSAIFRQTMSTGGDDPGNFVIDGNDWFHMNSAVYDARDDSLLVSSRENFVVKLDYATGALKWILGDTTKHWYADYPSLQALALTYAPDTVPLGQHSLSLLADGRLLLFDNGAASFNNPPGTSTGVSRTYSRVVAYRIDETARTATVDWSFDNSQQVLSLICSSVFLAGENFVINYAADQNMTQLRMLAIDPAGNSLYDFRMPTSQACGAGWKASPIAFDQLRFD